MWSFYYPIQPSNFHLSCKKSERKPLGPREELEQHTIKTPFSKLTERSLSLTLQCALRGNDATEEWICNRPRDWDWNLASIKIERKPLAPRKELQQQTIELT